MRNQLIIIFMLLVLLCGCSENVRNEPPLSEFSYISYNGIKYTEASQWRPKGDKIDEKLEVHLVDYNNMITEKKYYACGYVGDKEKSFLYFGGETWVKADATFVDILDKGTNIDRIKLSQLYSEDLVFKNDSFIKEFMNEYKNIDELESSELKRWGANSYDVKIYIKDYYAYYVLDTSIAIDKQGRLGFENRSTNPLSVCLLSQNLNKQIKDCIDKIN